MGPVVTRGPDRAGRGGEERDPLVDEEIHGWMKRFTGG